MDSPTDPYNVDPDDNVFRFLADYCPSPPHSPIMFNIPAANAQNVPPLPPPNIEHVAADLQNFPPPSPTFNADASAQNVNNNDFSTGFEFDIDVDDLINFGSEGEEETAVTDPPPVVTAPSGTKDKAPAGAGPSGTKDLVAAGAGPSGTKELGFHWAAPGALECEGCTVVGELYDYSNGLYNIRIAVHVAAGKSDHLVFDAEGTDFDICSGIETYFMNFEGQSLELINSSLEKYAIQIDANAAIILQKPFIVVYNLILDNQVVVGHREGGSTSSQQTSESNEENTDVEEGSAMDESAENPQALPWINGPGESSGAASAENNDDAVRLPPPRRPSVGIQRERTANMSIADLVPYFHLKAEDASKMLNICPTTLKILCRKLKLGRWPHRKVKSIDNRIRRLKKQIKDRAGERDMQAISGLQDEIKKEEEKRAKMYAYLTRPR